MNAIETAAQFRELVKLRVGEIDVDGVLIHVRELGGAESSKIQEHVIAGGLSEHFWPLICVYGVVDSSGANIYTESDVEEVAKFPARVLQAVGQEIMKLSGMDEAGEIEAEGN